MQYKNFDFSKKLIFHPESIVKIMNEERIFPISFEIDLTNLCNHNCSFCCVKEIRRTDMNTLKTETIKSCIKQMKELGVKGISFTGGGEPLLHKDFYEILEYTKTLGIDTGLITNGALIVENNVQMLLKNINWIRVSVAAGERETYSKIQGKDEYNKVINNLKLLSEYKEKLDLSVNIGVRMLITDENIMTLSGLAEDIKNLNVNYLQIAPDSMSNNYNLYNFTDFERIVEQTKTTLDQIDLLSAGFIMDQDKKSYPQKCYAHCFHTVVTASGDVLFCKNCRGSENMVIGNIYESSLVEIWNSHKNLQLEKELKPANCGFMCKNMAVNTTLEALLNPSNDMSINFLG